MLKYKAVILNSKIFSLYYSIKEFLQKHICITLYPYAKRYLYAAVPCASTYMLPEIWILFCRTCAILEDWYVLHNVASNKFTIKQDRPRCASMHKSLLKQNKSI